MALDPNIALAYKGIELPNQLAQYGQLAQIQHAQNQNRLADMQMAEYERARMEEEGARAFLKSKDLTAPETISGLPQFGKTGMGYAEKLIGQRKTNLEIQDKEFDLKNKRLDRSIKDFANFDTVGDVLGHIKKQLDAGEIDRTQAQQLASQVPQTDADLPKFQIAMLRRTLGAKDQLDLSKQTFKDTDRGGYIERQTLDWQGKPVGTAIRIDKTATIGEQTGQSQLKVAQDRLAFEQNKFAFEKANPTLAIQEDQNGLLAVNTKTGVATPVVYGPTGFQAAPAAAPGASMMRQQPAALPGQRMPTIPGMTSVLDQTAAPSAMAMPAEVGARMPGMPVGSKKEAPAKFNDTDMQLAGLAGSLKDFKEEVGKNLFTGAKFVPSGQDTARMTAKYTALLMGVKDLYTLGALTGPDMSIIESQLTNPASWSGKFKTKEGFNEQVKVIEDMLKRSTTNLETTYGRVPKASRKALEGLPGGASGGIPGATETNPLALRIPGVR